MPTVAQGSPVRITLDPGMTMIVTADAQSSGLVRRSGSPGSALSAGSLIQNIAASGKSIFGPFGTPHHYTLEPAAGKLTYTLSVDDFPHSVMLQNVEAFTGNRTLRDEDNGKFLRCDDSSNVTITVPNSLVEGFNMGFGMWSTGTVTISAGSGATKRGSAAALGTQYQTGTLIVVKNTTGILAEFTLAGQFA